MSVGRLDERRRAVAPGPDPLWDAAANPAVTALLEHLAEELAREYVRLMELAAEKEGEPAAEPQRDEG
jgi:hypothetical protein